MKGIDIISYLNARLVIRHINKNHRGNSHQHTLLFVAS